VRPRALLLTGTVGVGKTTLAAAVGDLLRERQVANAVVDLDELRRAWPPPAGDLFATSVLLDNLSAVAARYVGRGFSSLVLAGVLETAADRARHEKAVGMPLTVCRLVADPDVVQRRLRTRHTDDADGLGWHLHRAGELAAIQDASAVEDMRLDVTALPVRDAAAAVLERWDAQTAGGLSQEQARPHAWRIDEREYARQQQRRGRRHAFERLDPHRTALVVVDLVPFFVEGLPTARGIVPNVNRLARTLRAAGGTVAWVVPGEGPVSEEFFGTAVAKMYGASGGTGSPRQRLWPDLETDPDDLFAEKTAPSAFFPGRSPLPGLLADRGVDTVLVTGAVTNVCCESSARDAATLGYRVVMVADANAAPSDDAHNATLRTVYRSFGDVRPTDEVLALVAAG